MPLIDFLILQDEVTDELARQAGMDLWEFRLAKVTKFARRGGDFLRS